jgi:hypothetical protein
MTAMRRLGDREGEFITGRWMRTCPAATAGAVGKVDCAALLNMAVEPPAIDLKKPAASAAAYAALK